MKAKTLLYGMVAGILLLSASANAVIVYNNPGTLTGNELVGVPLTLGMDFTVINPGKVTAIGAFDDALNGIIGGTITVGIFNVGTGLVVPGTTVAFLGAAGTLIGSSRFITLGTSVLLGPGTYSIVAANYGGPGSGLERDFNLAFGGTAPTFDTAGGNLVMLGHRSAIGGAFAMPAGNLFASSDPAFGAGTFAFTPVPEAKTFALAGVALLGLVYVGRNLRLRQRTS